MDKSKPYLEVQKQKVEKVGEENVDKTHGCLMQIEAKIRQIDSSIINLKLSSVKKVPQKIHNNYFYY